MNKALKITLYTLMDSILWFETINLRWSIVYIEGSKVISSEKCCISIAPDKDWGAIGYLPTSFWLNWVFQILNWVFQVFVLGIHLKANKQ